MDELKRYLGFVSRSRSDRLIALQGCRKFDLWILVSRSSGVGRTLSREGKPPCARQKLSQTRQLPRARRSYDGCMNTTKCFCFLMAVILPATKRWPQTSERWPSDELQRATTLRRRGDRTTDADRQGDNRETLLAPGGRRGRATFFRHGGIFAREGLRFTAGGPSEPGTF